MASVDDPLCACCGERDPAAFQAAGDTLCDECARSHRHCGGCGEPYDHTVTGADGACDGCAEASAHAPTGAAG